MYCHDIDFVARPGETTAIIGSTGCGKSTLGKSYSEIIRCFGWKDII